MKKLTPRESRWVRMKLLKMRRGQTVEEIAAALESTPERLRDIIAGRRDGDFRLATKIIFHEISS